MKKLKIKSLTLMIIMATQTKSGPKPKNKLFTNENNQMDKIVHNNKLIKGFKNTCEEINNYFLEKIENLTN